MENLRHLEAILFTYDIQKLSREWGKYINTSMILFKIHYPGQFLLGDDPLGIIYPLLFSINSSYLQVFINEIEIIKTRQTRRKSCIADDFNYDYMIMTEHARKKGCREVYLSINNSFPFCNTEEKMKDDKFDFQEPDILKIPNACQRVSKMRFSAQTAEFIPRERADKWGFLIYYPKEIRIITQSKEVDIHTLIGNIGGYLGLFMGKLTILYALYDIGLNNCD